MRLRICAPLTSLPLPLPALPPATQAIMPQSIFRLQLVFPAPMGRRQLHIMQAQPGVALRLSTIDVARQLFTSKGSLHPMPTIPAVVRKLKAVGVKLVSEEAGGQQWTAANGQPGLPACSHTHTQLLTLLLHTTHIAGGPHTH